MKKIKGFTLAEVLITLAIIGVVSAITIPTVITNHRKTTYVTQLKKNYSGLMKGFKTAMAKDGVYNLMDTKMWTSIPGEGDAHIVYNMYWQSANSEFRKEFEKIFSVIGKSSAVTYKYLNGNAPATGGSRSDGLILADGSYMYMWFYKNGTPQNEEKTNGYINNKGRKIRSLGYIYIDVNGDKSPNQWGRDMYWLDLANDGNLYPHMGRDEYFTENNNYNNYNITTSTHCLSSSDGLGCAARIMEEGWKMNY